MNLKERLECLFGKENLHYQLLMLYYENPTKLRNMRMLTEELHVTYQTLRAVIDDLKAIGVLEEENIGRSKIIKLNRKTKMQNIVFGFIGAIQSLSER